MSFPSINDDEETEFEDFHSVSQLNSEVRKRLRAHFHQVKVKGEISDYFRASSGHAYFTLKDARSQVSCVMFRDQNAELKFVPAKGIEVHVYGEVELYEPRGRFQLRIETMDKVGSGLLHEKFEKLKKKLETEGLFEQSRKKKLPAFPRVAGIITSPKGAVIRDIISVCRRRLPCLRLIIYPSAVQGTTTELEEAIDTANRHGKCDVLIIARGGGDAEDLQCFNAEKLARRIAASRIPVVSGVGHQTDFTICDFVADFRAATPTAAAEHICPDRENLRKLLFNAYSQLDRTINRMLAENHSKMKVFSAELQVMHPLRNIEQMKQKTDEFSGHLESFMSNLLHANRNNLASLSEKLQNCSPTTRILRCGSENKDYMHRLARAMQSVAHDTRMKLKKYEILLKSIDPLAILQRGYALATKEDGMVIRSESDVEIDENISVLLGKGNLGARVHSKTEKP